MNRLPPPFRRIQSGRVFIDDELWPEDGAAVRSCARADRRAWQARAWREPIADRVATAGEPDPPPSGVHRCEPLAPPHPPPSSSRGGRAIDEHVSVLLHAFERELDREFREHTGGRGSVLAIELTEMKGWSGPALSAIFALDGLHCTLKLRFDQVLQDPALSLSRAAKVATCTMGAMKRR